MTIDTHIDAVVVEIEDNEYPVAEKTIDTLKRLREAEKAAVDAQKTPAEMHVALLEVMLGKQATKKLFPKGTKENADRIEAIYTGVLEAFDYNAARARAARTDAVTAEMRALMDELKPLREMLTLMRGAPSGNHPVIPKPKH